MVFQQNRVDNIATTESTSELSQYLQTVFAVLTDSLSQNIETAILTQPQIIAGRYSNMRACTGEYDVYKYIKSYLIFCSQ